MMAVMYIYWGKMTSEPRVEDNRNAKSRNRTSTLWPLPLNCFMAYGAPFSKLRTDHRLPSSGTVSIMPHRNSQSSHSNTPTDPPPSATCKPALFEIWFQAPHKSIVLSPTCIPAANARNMHDMSTQEQHHQPLQVVLHRLITYRALSFRFGVVLHQHRR